ncbi:MAG: hypothetical protein IJ684_02070 [Bacteroidales bacterium]|nr:hypothetical protein [Bacteroidales bacterium]
MIKLFKQRGIAQWLILLVSCGLLWSKALYTTAVPMPNDGFAPLYELLYNWLSPYPTAAMAVAWALIVAEGFLLAAMLNDYKLSPVRSLLPALMYIVAMSYHASSLTLTPMLVVNLTVILMLRQLLLTGNVTLPTEKVFNAALFVSLATLFYMPAATLLIPLLISLAVYKMYSWRDWIVTLLGIAAPYIVLVTYYFLTDQIDFMLYMFSNDVAELEVHVASKSVLHSVANAFFVLFLLVATVATSSHFTERTIEIRKNATVVMLVALAAVAMLFFSRLFPVDTQLFAVPFAFAGTVFLLASKRKLWFFDTLLTTLVVLGSINEL